MNHDPASELDAGAPVAADLVAEKERKKKKKPKRPKLPERDIQTWFRLTSKNLYTRRQQLDQKSNILLSINAVMLTLIVGTVYPSIDGQPYQLMAMMPVAIANLLSMFLAVRAMRPQLALNDGRVDRADVVAHRARLTTFDDFYRMTESEYLEAVDEVLKNQDFVHSSLTRDIYHLGIQLARRYRVLEWAYDIFVFGVMATALLFVLVEATMATAP